MLCYASYVMYSIYVYIHHYILYCTGRNGHVRVYSEWDYGMHDGVTYDMYMNSMVHNMCYACFFFVFYHKFLATHTTLHL